MFVMRAGGGLAVTAAVGVLAGGCAEFGTAAEDGRPSVAASSYPLAFVAERVGSPSVDVVDLSASSTDSHDLELTPHQVGEIAQADLVVYQSDYQPAVAEAVEQHANGSRIDVAAETDAVDPHVWLDPTLLGRIAESVAAALTDVAPDETADIERRADDLVAELRDLDDEFRAGLARCQRRTVVVSHDAFGHLADRYGLHFTGIAGAEPDAEPSPARLGEVEELIRRERLTTVFYEPLLGSAVAETIATDLGVETAVLDPIEGLTEKTRDEDYLSLMRGNLAALQKANGCA